MYVVVEHRIADPERFWSTAQEAAQRMPAGVTLHQTLSNAEGTRAVCLWEAGSLGAVRELIEPEVGQFSANEYFEVDASKAMGLPGR